MRTLAIDIGGSKFTLGGFAGENLVLRETRNTLREGGPAWMVGQIGEIIREWHTRHSFQPDRCGIGFGGPVDFPTQTVILSTHVEGWDRYPLIENIRSLIGVPIIMDNDANVGGLGEAHYGSGRGAEHLFYMTLSTGIGGGVIVGGHVYRGADSYAGEIGHLNILPDGPACLCGSAGCYERMCCGLWLERDYGRPANELFSDPEFVKRYTVYLARGLKAALMILNPTMIVIGGGISKAGDKLFVPLRKELDRQMPAWSRARREVRPAKLLDDSVLWGALALVDEISQ